MFSLSDLKKTRAYQDIKEEAYLEAKLEAVPRLLALGLNAEQVAQALNLSVEQVRQVAANNITPEK